LDFQWALLFLTFLQEVARDEDEDKILDLAEELDSYPPCYFVKAREAEIYLKKKGRLRKARQLYEELIELNPRLAIAYLHLGSIAFHLGLYEKAAGYYRKAVELALDDEKEIRASSYRNLALIKSLYEKDHSSARSLLEKALIEIPDHPQTAALLKQLKRQGNLYTERQPSQLSSLLARLKGEKKQEVREGTLWVPTEEVAQRVIKARLECWANTPSSQLADQTPMEAVLNGLTPRDVLTLFELAPGDPMNPQYLNVLTINASTLSRESVYELSGGLMNIFNEPVKSRDDAQFEALVKENLRKGMNYQTALEAAAKQWKTTPHDLFSGMSPALVWGGGGEEELRLLDEFCRFITDKCEGVGFPSKGERILTALSFLRQWLLSPDTKNREWTRQEVIYREREKILHRKLERLRGAGLLVDLFEPDTVRLAAWAKELSRTCVIHHRAPVRTEPGYYLFNRDGVTIAVASRTSESGEVEAAMFCLDEWRDGLFRVFGRRFETHDELEETLRASVYQFQPSNLHQVQMAVAYGLRIRRAARLPLPKEFDYYAKLVGPLDFPLPSSLYACPRCDGPLPDYLIKEILGAVGTKKLCYMLCEKCAHGRLKPEEQPAYLIAVHEQMIRNLEQLEGFVPTTHGEAFVSVPPDENALEAIELMLKKDGDLQAICFALEKFIANVAVPNHQITDQTLVTALENVTESIKTGREVAEPEERAVSLIEEKINDALDAFSEVYYTVKGREPDDNLLLDGLSRVLKSVRNHTGPSQPRGYIEFIRRFV